MRTCRVTLTGQSLLCAAAVVLLISAGAAAVQPSGNVERGEVVARGCQACHGAHGEGMPAAGYPRLAGQRERYLGQQLRDYASGLRNNPVMTPLAKAISDEQRADVAAYYASLSAAYAASTKPQDVLIIRGQLLARSGDESKQLQACANCHGPDGSGEAFAAPYLAGQSATYLASAINEWKSGARKNDSGNQMAVVAARLDEKDAAAIAAYFEALGRSGR